MRAMSASILYQLRVIVKFEEAGEGWWVPSPAVRGAGVAEHVVLRRLLLNTGSTRVELLSLPPSQSVLSRGTGTKPNN